MMNLEPADEHRLEAAKGFWELGMPQSALDEMSELPVAVREHPEVLQIQLAILMEEDRWPEALAVSKALCRVAPDEMDGWIKVSFCLHEMKQTQAARDHLMSGPSELRECALFYYNLACYECQLGHLQEAWLLLERAIQLDNTFKKLSHKDSDLAPLRAK